MDDFQRFAYRVREPPGGIPIGFKSSANHVEHDIESAPKAGADYIILDRCGVGHDVTLIIAVGMRVPSDFIYSRPDAARS